MRQPVPMQQTQQPAQQAQPQIGERRTTRSGQDVVYDGRGWREVVKSESGSNTSAPGTGQTMFDPTDTRGVQASAEQRGRIGITFAPALEAQDQLRNMEAQHGNVFNQEWGARMLEAIPFDGGAAARMAGGPLYGQYESAGRAFESSTLPILSGAAVTDSEARRMIRAALPQLGDSPEVLAEKSRRREQMLNGAFLSWGGQGWLFPESAPSFEQRRTSEMLPPIPLAERRTSTVAAAPRTMANRAGQTFPLTPQARIAYSRLPDGYDPSAPVGSSRRPMYLFEGFRETDLRVGDYGVTPDGRLVQGTAPRPVAIPGQQPRQGAQQPAGGQQPVRITGDADYNRLPSGARFIGPDGVERVKP